MGSVVRFNGESVGRFYPIGPRNNSLLIHAINFLPDCGLLKHYLMVMIMVMLKGKVDGDVNDDVERKG
jgi:hypothetical protein